MTAERGAALRVRRARRPSAFIDGTVLVVALAYDTPDPLPTLAVAELDGAPRLHTAGVCGGDDAAASRRAGCCGTRASLLHRTRRRGLRSPELRVCGGFTQLFVQRPALSKLKLLSNAVGRGRGGGARADGGGGAGCRPSAAVGIHLPHVLEAKRILYLDTDVLVSATSCERCARRLRVGRQGRGGGARPPKFEK